VQGEKIIRKENPLISDQDFDDLKTALDVARSNYDVELSTAKALIGEARTRLADLRVAEQALADTTIRAPFDKYAGPSEELSARPSTQPSDVPAPPSAENARSPYNAEGKFKRYRVAGRMHSPGELLQAVSGMFTLVDDDPVKLKASVPERYFSDVALGQEVVITAEAYPKECRGKISRINPQIDVTNRTFAIEVLIDNKEHQIPTGVFAHGEILTRKEKALFVPATAISSFAGNYKVFVIENGKVTERQVEIGERRKGPNDVDLIEVTKPKNAKVELKPGETIATSGTSRLANGVAVELKSAPTSAPATHPATLPTEKP
jgi:multidrug efflux pump subunit AcrA (membrane-fusion protein)